MLMHALWNYSLAINTSPMRKICNLFVFYAILNMATSSSISAGSDQSVRLCKPCCGQIASTVKSSSLFSVVADVHLMFYMFISVIPGAPFCLLSSPKLTLLLKLSFSANRFSINSSDCSNNSFKLFSSAQSSISIWLHLKTILLCFNGEVTSSVDYDFSTM